MAMWSARRGEPGRRELGSSATQATASITDLVTPCRGSRAPSLAEATARSYGTDTRPVKSSPRPATHPEAVSGAGLQPARPDLCRVCCGGEGSVGRGGSAACLVGADGHEPGDDERP